MTVDEERRFLLTSLRDLEREHDAGDLDDDDYVALRDDYTARAAALLRTERDAATEPDPESAPPVSHVSSNARNASNVSRRRAIVVAGVLLFAILAGLAVASVAGLRTPGTSATGAVTADSNTLMAEARALMSTRPLEAVQRFDQVLKTDPDNPEALAYRGWLVVQAGAAAQDGAIVDRGEQSIDRAITVKPSYADAHFFKAWVLLRLRNDPKGAIARIDTFKSLNPPREMLTLVDGLRAEAVSRAG